MSSKAKIYTQNICYYVQTNNFNALAELVRLNSDVTMDLFTCCPKADQFLNACKELPNPWDSIFQSKICTQVLLGSQDFVSALETFRKCVSVFLTSVLSNGTRIHLPVLYSLMQDLADVSTFVDATMNNCSRELQNSMQLFQMALAACIGDRSGHLDSKKYGALKVVNLQMKLFFQADQTALISKLIGTFSHRFHNENLESTFSTAELITYRYYFARDCILDDKFFEAENHLEYVLKNLPHFSPKNKELVMLLLVPLRATHGILPSRKCFLVCPELKKLYSLIFESIRSASICGFDEGLSRISKMLRKYAIFDLFCSLKWILFRTIVKKAYF